MFVFSRKVLTSTSVCVRLDLSICLSACVYLKWSWTCLPYFCIAESVSRLLTSPWCTKGHVTLLVCHSPKSQSWKQLFSSYLLLSSKVEKEIYNATCRRVFRKGKVLCYCSQTCYRGRLQVQQCRYSSVCKRRRKKVTRIYLFSFVTESPQKNT